MANSNNSSKVEPTTRVGDLPAQMPDDEAPRDFLDERAEEEAKHLDENTEFSKDEETGEVVVTVQGTHVNPSSTYPGRNQELREHGMALPTEIDLAKRAKAAGSQIPAAVFAAGLVDEDGNIKVGEEAPAEDSDEE